MGWLIFSIALWGFVHSVFASDGVKDWFAKVLGESIFRFYRLAYNLFSVISILPSLWLWLVLPDVPVYQIPTPWVYLTTVGQSLAAVTLVIGVYQTDAFSFIGLRQLFAETQKVERFVTGGLYHWVRHPLYTAGLIFMWLIPVVSRNTLIFMICASLYLIIGAHYEERKLMRQFGSAYAAYKSSTPMLVPGLHLRWN